MVNHVLFFASQQRCLVKQFLTKGRIHLTKDRWSYYSDGEYYLWREAHYNPILTQSHLTYEIRRDGTEGEYLVADPSNEMASPRQGRRPMRRFEPPKLDIARLFETTQDGILILDGDRA